MKYNKLVRDKIPEYIIRKGGNPITRIADEEEYDRRLIEKLLEEVGEFRESGSIEEFADIMEVMEAIAKKRGFSEEEIKETKEKKFLERGGFLKRIILEEA